MKLGRVFELKYDVKFEALKMALEGRSKENWKLKLGWQKKILLQCEQMQFQNQKILRNFQKAKIKRRGERDLEFGKIDVDENKMRYF